MTRVESLRSTARQGHRQRRLQADVVRTSPDFPMTDWSRIRRVRRTSRNRRIGRNSGRRIRRAERRFQRSHAQMNQPFEVIARAFAPD